MPRVAAMLFVVLCVAPSTHSTHLRQQVTPVQKVIELLGKLSVQIQDEGAKEAIEYDKYSCFCKDQVSQKTYQVEKSEERIAQHSAKVEELGSRISALDTQVGELGQRITDLEGEVSTEETKRQGEQEKYMAQDKDIVEAIDAVEEAIEIMKNSKSKMQGDVKLDLNQLTKMTGQKVALLVASQKPHAYEYRSNDIIAVLEQLKDTFKATKKRQDDDEFAAVDASAKRLLAMANEKKFKGKSKAEKAELSAQLSEEKGEQEKAKTEETTAMDADKAFLTELTAQCESKAKEWDQRSKSRAAELTALAEAVESLKTGVAPNYAANKRLVGLVASHGLVRRRAAPGQTAATGAKLLRAPTLLQVGGGPTTKEVDGGKKAMAALAQAAKQLRSMELGALVAKAQLQDDHFAKVRGLIKDLINRLQAEASSELDQKTFCDGEMAKAISTRDQQSLALEQAISKLVGKESEKAALLGEIKTLSEEVAALNTAMMEATELRQGEQAGNTRTTAEAAEGKAAVQEAIKILETYYGASGSFVQRTHAPVLDREGKAISDLAPETTYSGEYRGNQDASKGIIALLNVILSDFERTETTVADAEKMSQTEFDNFKSMTQTSIDDKGAQIKTKEAEVEAAKQAIVEAKDAIKTATGLKATAVEALEKLSAMCVSGGETYAQRKEQREQEIEALKRALSILEEWQQ